MILYEGPSLLNGEPIVVIATGVKNVSHNQKTGALIQTWILPQDVSPLDAVKNGQDAMVCGDCKHRGHAQGDKNVGRACYVNVFQAPLNIWRTYKAGKYPHAVGAEQFAGRLVRLGAYGDPAAVPFYIWEWIMDKAEGGTGYTHQWRECDSRLMRYCMASVDNEQEAEEAAAMGWRYFRVALDDEKMPYEVVCPASAEAGHKLQCEDCLACGGLAAKAKAHIVIQAHGGAGKVNAMVKEAA